MKSSVPASGRVVGIVALRTIWARLQLKRSTWDEAINARPNMYH